jgi:hypothetical protein
MSQLLLQVVIVVAFGAVALYNWQTGKWKGKSRQAGPTRSGYRLRD